MHIYVESKETITHMRVCSEICVCPSLSLSLFFFVRSVPHTQRRTSYVISTKCSPSASSMGTSPTYCWGLSFPFVVRLDVSGASAPGAADPRSLSMLLSSPTVVADTSSASSLADEECGDTLSGCSFTVAFDAEFLVSDIVASFLLLLLLSLFLSLSLSLSLGLHEFVSVFSRSFRNPHEAHT